MTTFYTLHTTIVPVLLITLMGFHFWRVRRAGGVVVPPAPAPHGDEGDESETVLFLPHLLIREIAQALVVVAAVVVLGASIGAPIDAPANPGMSPNPTTAPWYFVGFQELLIHLHPIFALLAIPLVVGLGFVLLPYIASDDEPAGRWFLSPVGRRTAGIAAALGGGLTAVAVVTDAVVGARPGWFAGGLLPFLAVVVLAAVGAWLAKRRLGATTNEVIQAVVVGLASGFAVLTLIGAWFRGPGMRLVWPWLQ